MFHCNSHSFLSSFFCQCWGLESCWGPVGVRVGGWGQGSALGEPQNQVTQLGTKGRKEFSQ